MHLTTLLRQDRDLSKSECLDPKKMFPWPFLYAAHMEIKAKQESSLAWEKCVTFNVFLCYLQIPLQKLQSENWDCKLLRGDAAAELYSWAWRTRTNAFNCTPHQLLQLPTLHRWIWGFLNSRVPFPLVSVLPELYSELLTVPKGNVTGTSHAQAVTGWYPFAQSTPQYGLASIAAVVSRA